MEIRKFVASGKPQFEKYTKTVSEAEATQTRVLLGRETKFSSRHEAHLPKAEKIAPVAVKNEAYKVHSEPVESILNMGLSQISSQSQKTSFSNTKSKFTSSMSIIPRINGLPKSFMCESDGAKNINRQVRRFNSVGTYVVGINSQKQLSTVKSFESPTKTKQFTTYVSCVQTSLSNSWKFQERNTQRTTDSENEMSESKSAAAVQTRKALPLRIYSAISDSKNNEEKKMTVENSLMTDMLGEGLVSNTASKDKYKGSTTITGQHFEENLPNLQEESDRKTDRTIFGSQVRIQETSRAKRANFNCSENNVVYCHHCSLSINPTNDEKKASTENEHENEQKNSDKNIRANSVKRLHRRTPAETVTIQVLSPIRSLTFSTPGKSTDVNLSRRKTKTSLASVSVQEKNNWRSMSISSEVPIIIISSVDE